MTKYNVHVYEVVRVKVPNIEAESPEAAAKIAVDAYNPHELLCVGARGEPNVEFVDYAEEVAGYTVDLVGDEEYEHTVHLDCNFKEE